MVSPVLLPSGTCTLYRGALALNDMGVSLLERGAYRAALDTLKDAIFVMKRVFPSSHHLHPGSYDIDAKLSRAYSKLASSKLEKPCSLNVEIVPHNVEFEALRSVLLRTSTPCNRQVNFVIKIEVFDAEDQCVDVHSAILLHNFAVAHLSMSRLANSSSFVQRIRDGAFQLSSFARQTLGHLMQVDGPDTLEYLLQCNPCLILVTAAVLHCQIQILEESGGEQWRAVKSYQNLVLLSEIAQNFDKPQLCNSRNAAAA